ncbi:MAG: 3-phosphoshikimate 1-carboxyvinyltransferase [Pirellulaceae bacterium]|nr:3-phosphoshikimate 1-carboxyvinyltransferase [Pirellulaceae bacterium]
MADIIEIPTSRPVQASICLPGSKSLTNRALICAAMANGRSVLNGCLDSEDTRVMVDCLEKLGVNIDADWEQKSLVIAGTSGMIPEREADLFVANSGTTIRFLTALLAAGKGSYRLDGIPRMRERPIGDLLDSLADLGVNAISENDDRCPPVRVTTEGIENPVAQVKGSISSQYLSGLLMMSPLADKRIRLELDGDLVSRPYIDMTLKVMSSFGVQVKSNLSANYLEIKPDLYQACDYNIEPDASAASYFWAAAAITGGKVKVTGLTRKSLQGDVGFCECLVKMGCAMIEEPGSITMLGQSLTGIDINMNAMSDTVQTLAAVALFADGPTTIRGVAHNRHKETDRIGDLATELRKVGAKVEELDDGLRIIPGPLNGAELETYQDHRMAMSLALIGLKQPGIAIKNPECTAKTYPDYFQDLTNIIVA